MALEDVILPKQYQNTKVLFEQNLDAWREAAEQGFFTVNLNLEQIAKDCFLPGYQYDNDGLANYAQSLEQRINLIASGGTPLSGTSSDTFTVNSDGNSAILSTLALTGSHTYSFPDTSGTFVLVDATQTLTNKTLVSPRILDTGSGFYAELIFIGPIGNRTVQIPDFTGSLVGNNNAQTISQKTFSDNLIWQSGTLFTGTLDHANTADRVYTYPDATTTMVGTDTTQTLSNKSLVAPFITGAGAGTAQLFYENTAANSILTIPNAGGGGTFVLEALTQTLTNKTFSGGTFTGNIAGSPTLTGTITFSNPIVLPNVDPPVANTANRNGIVKAWGTWYTGALQASYNVVSVTNPGVGEYLITWDTNFAVDNNFALIPVGTDGLLARLTSKGAGVSQVNLFNSSTLALANGNFDFIAIGTQ